MIIGIPAPDIEAHPAHGFEHLSPVARQIARRHKKIYIGEIVPMQGAG
jgi:hypothetical protein